MRELSWVREVSGVGWALVFLLALSCWDPVFAVLVGWLVWGVAIGSLVAC